MRRQTWAPAILTAAILVLGAAATVAAGGSAFSPKAGLLYDLLQTTTHLKSFRLAQSTPVADSGNFKSSSYSIGTRTVTPAAGKIVFMSKRDGNEEIYIMNPDGTSQTRLTNSPGIDRMPCISPDGNKILFSTSRYGSGEICEMNLDGTGLTRLTNDGSDDLQPVYSPDGLQIAFSSNRAGGDYDVFLMNRDGSNIRRVTFNQLGDYDASWSPNDNQLCFATFYGNNYQAEVTRINVDSTGQVQLTSSPGGNAAESWGANNKIAFGSGRDGNDEIYYMDADGSNVTRITNNTTAENQPAWSPNAQQLVFTSTRDGSSEIHIANPDGSGQTRLTNNTAEDNTPYWGPPAGTVPPSFVSISDVFVTEGNSGTTQATITATLSAALPAPATVQYATAAGTATSDVDFSASTGTINFPANTTTQTFTIPIIGDTLSEAAEAFVVNLSNTSGAQIGDGQATVTIQDNDPLPMLSLDNVSTLEGDAGTHTIAFTASLSAPSGRTVTADYQVLSGTAQSGSDFAASNGTLTFAPGELTQAIPVSIMGDTLNEADETFNVRLTSATGAMIATAPTLNAANNHYYEAVNATLTWDQARTTAAARTFLGVNGHLATITSGAEQDFINTTFGISPESWIGGIQPLGSAEPAGGWEWVTGEPFVYSNWSIPGEPNNAGAGEDVIEIGGSGRWNDLSHTDTVPRYIVEYDFASLPANAPGPQGIGTIINDDPVPSLSISDATLAREGSSGYLNLNFTVTLSVVSGRNITFDYATGNGTAVAPDDFLATSGTRTISAGATSTLISVPVVGDTLVEADTETLSLGLANATNATIADGFAVGTIVDDDGTQVLSLNNVSVTEANSGTTGATFTVALSAPSTRTVRVDYTTVPIAPATFADFQPKSGTLEFAPGQTTATVTVLVNGDTYDEPNEYFYLSLSNPINAVTANAPTDPANSNSRGICTIVDNDPTPGVSINDVTIIEGASGTTDAVFTVTLSAASGQTVTVNYATDDITATQPQDYSARSGTLTIVAGASNGTIRVPVVGDSLVESNELFVVTLSSPHNATLGRYQGVGTITNDDSSPSSTPTPAPTATPTPQPITATIQQVALPTNDIVYDKVGRKIYASVPASAGAPRANSVTPIDPVTATIGNSVTVGYDPTRVVATDDGSYVYAAIIGATSIRRLDTATQTATLQYSLGNSYSALYAEDMETVPGHPHQLAVARSNTGISPRLESVAIFDDGVAKPNTARGANVIEMASATRMYGYLNELSSFDFVRWNVDNTGIVGGDTIHPITGYGNNIKYDSGRIYSTYGSIFDPEANVQLGSFPGGIFVPDGSVGRIFVLTQSGSTGTITAYNTDSFLSVGSITVPGISGSAGTLIRWGASGLAFRTSGGQVFLISTNLVAPQPELSLSVAPQSIRENAGAGAANGTLTRSNMSTAAPLTVNLSSSDTTEATVPSTVTIPAGATTVTFAIAAMDDAIMDGPQPVTITAGAANVVNTPTAALTVADNEVSSIRGRVTTANGTGLANIIVTRNNITNVMTDSNGNYVFTNVPGGNHLIAPLVTPALQGVTFTPATRIVANTLSGLTNINFVAGFSITGRLANSEGVGLPNVLVRRSTATSSTSVATDSSGNYRFNNVGSGDYTIAPQLTPSMNGMTFSPAGRTVTVSTANLTNISFLGFFSISGRVSNSQGVGIPNIQLTRRAGTSAVTVVTDTNGNYRFGDVRSGSYTVTPNITPGISGMSFNPSPQTVTVSTANLTNVNFLAFFSISGRITTSSGAPLADVLVTRSTSTSAVSVLTDEQGYYSFSDVRSGDYTISAALTGKTFTPASRAVTVGTLNLTNISFIGSPG